MKTIIKPVLAIVITMASFTGFSQNTVCGTDYFYEKVFQKDPSFQNVVEQNWMVSDVPATTERGARAVKIVPVVFHVFHDNGVGNISYEQILSAMDMINQDFRRTNPDTNNTRSLFKPFAADSEIEFRLALTDPNGNCTNGVVRINDPNASREATNSTKPVSRWPSNKYFNVWVVNSIESSGVNGTILGYAQFPGSGAWNTYGVIIRNDRVGNIGTATSRDRTLSHEIGHCFNLLHTFQSGCGNNCQSSGDRVCDTPPVDHSTQGCNRSQNQCSNDASGNSVYNTNVVDQIENYMSYDDCQNMFSLGQKSRMQSALGNFSTLASLISSNNLQQTGILNTNPGICKAEFEVERRVICVGQSITFENQSFFNPKSYSWNFEGGFPAISTDKNPTITYLTPGSYRVELSVQDSTNNSVSTSKINYITVLSSLGNTAPFQESFEMSQSLADANWYGNEFSTGLGWEFHTNGGALNSSHAIKANAYSQKGKIAIISAAFDASNLADARVRFYYAYAPKVNEGSNYMRVSISADCGKTWKGTMTFGGSAMATAPEKNSAYNFPANTDWEYKSFTVSSQYLSANTQIKFEFNADNGNNIFIDNLNITGTLGDSILLKWPENGAGQVSVTPTLNWNATSLVDYYTIQLDTDTSFNSPNLVSEQLNYRSNSSNDVDTEFSTDTLIDGQLYYWRVITSLNGVDTAQSETWSFTANSSVTGIETVSSPVSLAIYPNPANQIFTVSVTKTNSGNLMVLMYDVTGSIVKTIHHGFLRSGSTQFQINRNELSNGIYLIQVVTDSGITTERVILD